MRTIANVAAATLVAACVVTVSGCGSRDAPAALEIEQKIAETRAGEEELVRSTIADEERASRMIGLLVERDELIGRYVKILSQYRDEILAMNSDYAVSREQFEQKMASYNGARSALQKEFVALIDSMKKETTADEWKSIAKYQVKKLNPRNLAFEQALGGD